RLTPKLKHSPYTTLFRSVSRVVAVPRAAGRAVVVEADLEGLGQSEFLAVKVPRRQAQDQAVLPTVARLVRHGVDLHRGAVVVGVDRKSTRLNSSHVSISY